MNNRLEEDKDTGVVLNRLAREQMKRRLLADILADLVVCELECIDKTEYLKELKKEIDGLLIKQK